MTKQSKLTLATLALLLSALVPLVANAQLAPNYHRLQPRPKVVFIGDYITYEWASAFAANPNWINQGDPAPFTGSAAALARFQSDVVSLHPAVVHIMVGAFDAAYVSDESALFDFPGFVSNLDAMVKEAKAANIKVILGTTPPINTLQSAYVTQINAAIAGYGAANDIPVINYADLLCGCASLSTTNPFALYKTTTLMMPSVIVQVVPDGDGVLPSTAGYAQMTQLAEAAVATVNLTLQSGWLQDVELPNETLNGSPVNVNTASPPAAVQFTPIGLYSDGSQHPLLNTNVQGATGTWTSSNPVVMNVNQQGLAWALSPGTTIIRYTSPTGVAFSEWIMYITAP
jgi:acyl-CoA thioesterase I